MNYILVFAMIFCVSTAWATPPRSVMVSYDGAKLHIEADHPSDRLERHYIRRIELIKNGESTQNFYFPRQRASNQFVEDLEYNGKDGDHLDIKLYCSQGGIGQTSFDIGQPKQRKDSNDEKTL